MVFDSQMQQVMKNYHTAISAMKIIQVIKFILLLELLSKITDRLDIFESPNCNIFGKGVSTDAQHLSL